MISQESLGDVIPNNESPVKVGLRGDGPAGATGVPSCPLCDSPMQRGGTCFYCPYCGTSTGCG
jgi:hypothetical protein